MCRIASSMIMKIKVIRTLHSYISCERKLGTGYIRSSYVGLWILSSSSLMAEWDSGHGNAAAIAGNASTGMALLAVGRGLPSQTYGAERRGQLSRWPFSGVNFGALCFPRPSALVQPPHEAAQPSCGRILLCHRTPWQRNQHQQQGRTLVGASSKWRHCLASCRNCLLLQGQETEPWCRC